MNVDELLTYKPPVIPKRPKMVDEEEEDKPRIKLPPNVPLKKHKRIDMDLDITQIPVMEARREEKPLHFAEEILIKPAQEPLNTSKISRLLKSRKPTKEILEKNKSDLSIQQLLEKDAPKEVDLHSEIMLKRMILLFEKRTLKNREMRIKFPHKPEKFLESEMELFEIIKELHILAAMPDLYHLLVNLNAVPSILELLSHENTDISVAVIHLLQELTDVETEFKSTPNVEKLIDVLVQYDVFGLLVQNLNRLNESVKDEFEGVHDTLAIFENIIDLRSNLIDDIAKLGLLQWILKRLRTRSMYDSNKAYAVEMLSILLHDSVPNRTLFSEFRGIDIILQQLAYYKRFEPSTTEEAEMMENFFNCLCSCLLDEENRKLFLEGEGLQLMNLMLRERKYSRNGSLKALDHAMSGPFGADSCNKFVDILGLRTLFPLFMKTPNKKKKRTITIEEHEEHVLSIISSLFRHCDMPQRQRVIQKFVENDLEKVDRLMELHFKYTEKVDNADAEAEALRLAEKDVLTEEQLEEEIYLYRLDHGLYILQLIDYIILEICSAGPAPIKQRVITILGLKGGTLKAIRNTMREYAGMLENKEPGTWQWEQSVYILQLIDRF